MGKYAIFLVLALTFSLLTYSYALRNVTLLSNTRTVESHGLHQAQNISQSAAMLAITSVRNDEESLFYPAADESYSYPSENGFESWEDLHGTYNLLVSNRGDTLLAIEATGRFEESVYRTTVGLIIGPSVWDPVIDQAVHAEESIELGGSDYVGGRATLNSILENRVQLGSHSKIKISDDLFIGPGGDPDVVVAGDHDNVDGEIYNLPRKLKYPMPLFPEFPVGSPAVSSIYSSQQIYPPEYEGYYIPEIILGGNGTLTIHTGGEDRLLYVGTFDVQSGDVEIVGEGNLTVYVEDLFDMQGNSTVNSGGEVSKLMMYYRGNDEVDIGDETVDIGGNAIFNGSFFSREANIQLRGTAGIQGNVITGGSRIDLHGNASAISRVIYAPLASVYANGNVSVRGSVISDRFAGSGNTELIYDDQLDVELPDLLQDGNDFSIAYWN